MATVATKTIPLKPSKSCRKADDFVAWTRAPAFAVNPRGVLAHRVRHVTTILYGMAEHHHHVNYLCGNGCNVGLEAIDDALVSDPPTDRLLCEFCESKAARLELPSGDALAGRHVHRGVLVPKQTCCEGAVKP